MLSLLLPARWVEGQTLSLVQRSMIFDWQVKHVHASNLVCLPNGDLLAVWFEGSGERQADDVALKGSRQTKASGDWTTPFDMADYPGLPDCNPVLWLSPKGELFLFWVTVLANRWEQALLRYRISNQFDGPRAPLWHWQEDILLKPDEGFAAEIKDSWKDLPDEGHGWGEYAPPYRRLINEAATDVVKRSLGWMTRTSPLALFDGRVLLPLYSDGFNLSLMALSDDAGYTWRPGLPIVGKGNIQPALIQRKSGQLVAYMRDSGDAPSRLQVSTSDDFGFSWQTATKTDMPATASVAVHHHQSGVWLMVLNDVPDGRYRLTVYTSVDEGEHWTPALTLRHDESRQERYSYPGIAEDAEGQVYISYSMHLADGRKSIGCDQLMVRP